MPIKTEYVRSSSIKSVGHDPEENVMQITFKNTNKTYSYQGVDVETYEAIRDAESVGRAVNEFLEPRRQK